MTSGTPWLYVKAVEEGVDTVFATENNLKDFPAFMNRIVEHGIGKEQGFFKICIEGGTASSSIEDLLNFVQARLTSKPFSKQKTQVKLQTIIRPSANNDELVCVLREDIPGHAKIKQKKDLFLAKACATSSYTEDKSTCCSQALHQSMNDVLHHYWEVVRDNSGEPIFYGAGIPVEHVSFNVAGSFSLSKLGTILDLCPTAVPGIAFPYLYVGGPHSSFPWHIEDGAAFSINYLHHGAPCIWSFVSPRHYKKFLGCANVFPLDAAQVTCTNVFGHKYILADRTYLNKFGIVVHTVIQRQRELMVIYPFTPHSGFRTGYSLSEAANFGDPSWVELSILAPSCTCQ